MAYEVEAPKYVRLAQTIQRRIEDGTYAPGTRVPSENELVQAFGMSRPTVVRALERDGWLESRQGTGPWCADAPRSSRARIGAVSRP
nr:GntR family transcriptional regulator [Streptomyces sennicomposti]